MTDRDGLKIISLQAENIKRLVAVRIDPKGRALVEITGANGSGKTSVLDSIWWAIGGLANVQKSPIRRGQQKAKIRLDLGEFIITRTFARASDAGDEFTSAIAVESADGVRLSSPQRVLDSFYDALSFDPLEFARMKPRDQFDALRAMVPGADFEKLDGLNRTDFAKRTELNRQAKMKKAEAEAIGIPEAVPSERVDEAALVDEVASVGEHNAQIELRQGRRETVVEVAAMLRNDAAALTAKARKMREDADAIDRSSAEKTAEAECLEKQLREAEPLPEPKDAAEVRKRLEEAKRTNALIDKVARRKALQDEAEALEASTAVLTAAMEAREQEKCTAIANAKLPVDGLGFGDGHITLNGVPFDQASGAEQLRASMAIAMASNPRLRVIRCRDGSLLDEEGLRIVEEMAAGHDFQCWLERVDSTGKVGFALEAGEVRRVPADADPVHAAAE